jgi:hypothetical protein
MEMDHISTLVVTKKTLLTISCGLFKVEDAAPSGC